MLTPREKKLIKKLSHDLKPLIRIGKNGVTPATIANIDKALTDHTLIKVKFNDHKQHKKQLSQEIADKTKADIVDLIGNTLILHRKP